MTSVRLAVAATAEPAPKAVDLRAITSPTSPRPSSAVGVTIALVDYLLFYCGAGAAVAAPWWIVKIAGMGLAGLATAMLFSLGHDAAHGSLAGSRRMNRLLAMLCFLPSWYPYTPWIRGHNHLHHGWTNVAECDYSWRPRSPAEYMAMSRWRRGLERIYRAWWGLWLHSIVEIWWKHMAAPREDDRRYLHAGHLLADRLIVGAFVAGMLCVCWVAGPDWSTLAGGPRMSPIAIVGVVQIVPWWTFHALFSAVTFLHHTHPAVPWVRTKRESSFFAGQVLATVHVALPRWAEFLLHNINLHGAHHVDPRIPFRHLVDAQERIESAFADQVQVEHWSLALLIGVTRMCQLYDYDAGEWLTFEAGSR